MVRWSVSSGGAACGGARMRVGQWIVGDDPELRGGRGSSRDLCGSVMTWERSQKHLLLVPRIDWWERSQENGHPAGTCQGARPGRLVGLAGRPQGCRSRFRSNEGQLGERKADVSGAFRSVLVRRSEGRSPENPAGDPRPLGGSASRCPSVDHRPTVAERRSKLSECLSDHRRTPAVRRAG